MVDLHCHLLPGIDDGPASMDEAMALAGAAVAGGTRTIVATPHVSPGWPDNDAARIAEAVEPVRAELAARGIALEVGCGAEVALTRAVDLDDGELRALHLAGGPWLLLECPLSRSADGFEDGALELQARGHRILLAHPERSPHFRREPDALARLVATGMLAQVTASSFAGAFGPKVRYTAFSMLERGLVADVASDAHGARGLRAPGFAAQVARTGIDPAWVEHLALRVPAAIASGAEVPPPPAVAPRAIRADGGRGRGRVRGAS